MIQVPRKIKINECRTIQISDKKRMKLIKGCAGSGVLYQKNEKKRIERYALNQLSLISQKPTIKLRCDIHSFW